MFHVYCSIYYISSCMQYTLYEYTKILRYMKNEKKKKKNTMNPIFSLFIQKPEVTINNKCISVLRMQIAIFHSRAH